MMIFDTDVIIWVQRGNDKAARLIDKTPEKYISVQTYMELMQCAHSKRQRQLTRDFLHDFNFQVLPLTENIGHRAAVYIDEYALSDGLRVGDAVIAATSVENNRMLTTGNSRHFKVIKDLQLKVFKP